MKEIPRTSRASSYYVSEFVNKHLRNLVQNTYSDQTSHGKLMVEAARAHGLDVQRVGDTRVYLDDGRPIGANYKMLSSLASHGAVLACSSKSQTKALFRASQVPTPMGASFEPTERSKAQNYFTRLSAASVIKPDSGGAGNGVTCDVRTLPEFSVAWDIACHGLKKGGRVLIEEQVDGMDVRAYVVGGEVVAASTRIPAHVVGDGESTVGTLIEYKIEVRKSNFYLSGKNLSYSVNYLKSCGYSLEYRPSYGELILLNPTANLHQGGENVDVTDTLSSGLRDVAVSAVAAIPGLNAAGIDIMTHNLSSATGVVLEANATANIMVHHLPAYGTARNVAGALVRSMIRASVKSSD